jgi:hypothetical protein
VRKVGFYLVAAWLLFSGVIGIMSAVDDWGKADTLGRIVCTVFITALGCLGIGAGVAVLVRKPWARGLILAWAATLLVTVILAPIVWVWPGLGVTLLAVLVYSVLIVLTYWGWKATAGPQSD